MSDQPAQSGASLTPPRPLPTHYNDGWGTVWTIVGEHEQEGVMRVFMEAPDGRKRSISSLVFRKSYMSAPEASDG